MKDYVASTNGPLRLFFLPGYSPELNPDEWVWQNVKNDRVAKQVPTNKAELKSLAMGALRRLQKLPPHRPRILRRPAPDPHPRMTKNQATSSNLRSPWYVSTHPRVD